MGNSQGKLSSPDYPVNLNQFRLLRVVGKGAFGKVRIVERKDTGLTFALKYIRKDEVVRSESVRNIIRERRMLEHLNHPFLCNLRYSFQDMEYIYIVVDLMNGGDLRFHISRKCFTEEAIRFWMAELACALHYIHGQGIVHRDVKPDNILLDSEGHVHLADFNVASDFKPSKPLTSRSGTMAYLAPEVFQGGGYLSNVDWWSLGVTFYECIYSKRPFDGRSHNSLSEAIMRTQPKYYVTNPAVTVPCLHALSALLEKDPTKRIGAMNFESFTTHAFFAPIDFDALERKEIEPVFVPSSDKTNFDATYDLEELLLEEAPLEARARRQKPRAELKDDATAKEIREDELHRIIETMFEPFDYTTMNYETTAAAAIAASANPEDCLNLTTSPSQRRRHRHTNSQGRSGSSSPSVRTDRSTRTDKSTRTEKSYRSTASDTHGQNNVPVDSVNPGSPSSDRGGALSRSPPTQPPPGPPSLPSQRHANRSHTITSTNQGVPQFSPPPPSPAQPPQPQPRGATRNRSKSGGVQMVLEETGSWSGLADQTTNGDALPNNVNGNNLPNGNGSTTGAHGNSSGGMFSFFSRKKGRERSPKPSERGVLGKEGARVVISG
ncbi:serine/threonine-protein kinase [Trichophyton mentagrophytes]|uniref:Serine/threonine-protein kinase 32B n=2 Tax=Trichophyton interdigitale TaxID=101480 RepID=A0A9P4YP19_9EURO|nr:Serine/threonine-protein kinase 32B [Trichophyton interdigitale]KAF3901085.1 Serine/threonine-protein kinase 32B [Trichophyton interdigitale]KAG8212071.1 Serine/threonine-protein kinase 32B [Trichophyton interdigitale]GBF65673.1 serine/threonine-protein kinase [Trichophyton mentagrophytes]